MEANTTYSKPAFLVFVHYFFKKDKLNKILFSLHIFLKWKRYCANKARIRIQIEANFWIRIQMQCILVHNTGSLPNLTSSDEKLAVAVPTYETWSGSACPWCRLGNGTGTASSCRRGSWSPSSCPRGSGTSCSCPRGNGSGTWNRWESGDDAEALSGNGSDGTLTGTYSKGRKWL